MASWSSQGHGMRRREGNPSNHLESAGKNMARFHKTADEHYNAAAAAGSHRIPMGAGASAVDGGATMSSVDEINTAQLQGTLVPKKSTQAMDPTAGGKANRVNIEKIGASYRVAPKSTFVQLDPAAGPTMASARIVPSVAGRTGFDQAAQTSSL